MTLHVENEVLAHDGQSNKTNISRHDCSCSTKRTAQRRTGSVLSLHFSLCLFLLGMSHGSDFSFEYGSFRNRSTGYFLNIPPLLVVERMKRTRSAALVASSRFQARHRNNSPHCCLPNMRLSIYSNRHTTTSLAKFYSERSDTKGTKRSRNEKLGW